MKISGARMAAIYSAIHEAVMDVRVRAKTEKHNVERWDREAFCLPETIYRAVLKVLDDKKDKP